MAILGRFTDLFNTYNKPMMLLLLFPLHRFLKKWRHREIRKLAQSHTISNGARTWDQAVWLL
jgi:hypothetical protein